MQIKEGDETEASRRVWRDLLTKEEVDVDTLDLSWKVERCDWVMAFSLEKIELRRGRNEIFFMFENEMTDSFSLQEFTF